MCFLVPASSTSISQRAQAAPTPGCLSGWSSTTVSPARAADCPPDWSRPRCRPFTCSTKVHTNTLLCHTLTDTLEQMCGLRTRLFYNSRTVVVSLAKTPVASNSHFRGLGASMNLRWLLNRPVLSLHLHFTLKLRRILKVVTQSSLTLFDIPFLLIDPFHLNLTHWAFYLSPCSTFDEIWVWFWS